MKKTAKNWDGDTVVGIGLVVVVMTVLRNEEFVLAKLSTQVKSFREDDMINDDT